MAVPMMTGATFGRRTDTTTGPEHRVSTTAVICVRLRTRYSGLMVERATKAGTGHHTSRTVRERGNPLRDVWQMWTYNPDVSAAVFAAVVVIAALGGWFGWSNG
jgi:hypothetical protein